MASLESVGLRRTACGSCFCCVLLCCVVLCCVQSKYSVTLTWFPPAGEEPLLASALVLAPFALRTHLTTPPPTLTLLCPLRLHTPTSTSVHTPPSFFLPPLLLLLLLLPLLLFLLFFSSRQVFRCAYCNYTSSTKHHKTPT